MLSSAVSCYFHLLTSYASERLVIASNLRSVCAYEPEFDGVSSRNDCAITIFVMSHLVPDCLRGQCTIREGLVESFTIPLGSTSWTMNRDRYDAHVNGNDRRSSLHNAPCVFLSWTDFVCLSSCTEKRDYVCWEWN